MFREKLLVLCFNNILQLRNTNSITTIYVYEEKCLQNFRGIFEVLISFLKVLMKLLKILELMFSLIFVISFKIILIYFFLNLNIF